MAEQRWGLGFDVHPWDETRELRLGGIVFEGEPGLAGHSDADVVCHAIADAVLGAAAMGDLGEHFPEGDASTVGLGGVDLLAGAVAVVAGRGWRPEHCDATVLAARPPIAPKRGEMRSSIASGLGIAPDGVSVKATRPEGLGLTGDGVGCLAVVTLSRRE